MITKSIETVVITCDKCKSSQTASEKSYNQDFFADGWLLNRGRKYMHLCFGCQTAKQRKLVDFMHDKFGILV